MAGGWGVRMGGSVFFYWRFGLDLVGGGGGGDMAWGDVRGAWFFY